MPEARAIPLVRFGEALRRERGARRRARFRVVAIVAAVMAASASAATLLWPPRPEFVWNASASSPVGLYRVTSAREVRRGDMVVAWAPAQVRALAAERHYLPSNVPLVKRVVAGRGDRVCAAGEAVFVRGELAVLRRSEDPSGRPLPWWTGCEDLRDGELFLLAPAANAFDGRYFGVSRPQEVVGRARLIWPL
jgi:conjugative transfer signal peptidase TraF